MKTMFASLALVAALLVMAAPAAVNHSDDDHQLSHAVMPMPAADMDLAQVTVEPAAMPPLVPLMPVARTYAPLAASVRRVPALPLPQFRWRYQCRVL